jgi:hypothetical protein
MKRSLYRHSAAFILCVLFISLSVAEAQWSDDPTVNNPVCSATNNQQLPQIVSDGSGGAIIAWQDYRGSANSDVYAQSINSNGVEQWATDGVAICTAASKQDWLSIVSDGSGGAIIVWTDHRGGVDTDIYAQRINSSGVVQWTADGTAICSATGEQSYATAISDGSGGAIITWEDYRSGTKYDIYAQRINAGGVVQWPVNGVAICTTARDKYSPMIISDGSTGAIIVWNDFRSGSTGSQWDTYAQKINSTGIVQWTADGVPVCTAAGYQLLAIAAADGFGGAIITWEDHRNGTTSDVYAQCINSSGAVQWTADGVTICNATGDQFPTTLVSDGSGGAIISWYDHRNAVDYDIYARRINSSGVVQWTSNGEPICTRTGDQLVPRSVSDGSGGAIITWYDHRNGANYDIYAQSINSSGVVQWTTDGAVICSEIGDQDYPKLVSAGAGGAIITWYDYRWSTTSDIYASRVYPQGNLPLELVSFSAEVLAHSVRLDWTTSKELNSLRFAVERRTTHADSWQEIGSVAAHVSTNRASNYSFTDTRSPDATEMYYRLRNVDIDGSFSFSNEVRVGLSAPDRLTVFQNYPNPFHPGTTIKFQVPNAGVVTLKVYNALGREVATLVNKEMKPGSHEATFDASGLARGVYFYRLQSGSFTESRKLVLK